MSPLQLISNYQLYALCNNKALHKGIKENALSEWNKRLISNDELNSIIDKYKTFYPDQNITKSRISIHPAFKVLLLIIPTLSMLLPFYIGYVILAYTIVFVNNNYSGKRHMKSLMLYLFIGYLLQFSAIILFYTM